MRTILATFLAFLVIVPLGRSAEANATALKTDEKTLYERATKDISKILIAPATARFAKLGTDEEARVTEIGNGVIIVHGYVDSQNAFSALLRKEWDVYFRPTEGKTEIVAVRFGDETVGDIKGVVDFAKGMDPVHGFRLKDGIQVTGKELEAQREAFLAEKRIARRVDYHQQAKTALLNWIQPKGDMKHSQLLPADDAFTVCRELGNGVWEARGVFQVSGKQSPWRVLFQGRNDGSVEAMFMECLPRHWGTESAALRAAGNQ